MNNLQNLTLLYIDFEDNGRKKYLNIFKKYFKDIFVTDTDLFEFYYDYRPDIIVIELLVPEAISFIKEVRRRDDRVLIVALTNDSTIKTLMDVVNLSLTSYIVKPTTDKILQDELLKISQKISQQNTIYLPQFCQWDVKSKTLIHKDKVIFLTKKESKLFELLIKKKGEYCSDDEILFHIWGDDFNKSITKSSVRTLIKNLRRKLPEGLIENQYGVGYKIIA
jgi:DNA-binding response OmpR family regulator